MYKRMVIGSVPLCRVSRVTERAAVWQGLRTHYGQDYENCYDGASEMLCSPDEKTSYNSKDDGMKLPLEVGTSDFKVVLHFKTTVRHHTAASLSFDGGENIGLDGGGGHWFVGGGSWGSSTKHGMGPSSQVWHVLDVNRINSKVSIFIDGIESPIPQQDMSASPTWVTARPWRVIRCG